MSKSERQGSCLCGEVKLTAKTSSDDMGACHCSMCQKWGGGPYLSNECGADVALNGEESISVYSSSAWAERGFCRKCGTHLFYRLKESREYFVPIGLFENADGLVFDRQIFIDEKPACYSFAEKTSDLTRAEVFAKFAPPE